MKLQSMTIACGIFFTLAGAVRGGVIVVDAAGGGAFTQIQPAVDAALAGDTILVKAGSYSAFTVDGKALTVVGDTGTRAIETGKPTIKNLASGKTVTLSGLLTSGNASDGEALRVIDCPGAVRLVQCEFTGSNGSETSVSGIGAVIWNANDVAFAGCTILGGAGKSGHTCLFDTVGVGRNAVNGLGTNSVAAYDCLIRGGHGGNGGDRTGPGGAGVELAGFMFISRCNIQGGHGGDTDCPMYACPNDGGDGFDLSPASIGWILDAMVAGGAAGEAIGFSKFECPGDSGQPFPHATPFVFSAPNLGFSIPAVAREGTHVTVTFTGPPGAHVFLNDELTTTFQGVPSWRGVLLSPFPTSNSSGPVRTRRWGVIPASGELTQVYGVPMLPAGVEAQTRFLQAYRIGPNGLTLGSFKTLTVLDSAF